MVIKTSKLAWSIPTFDDLAIRNPDSKLWQMAYMPDGRRHIYIPKTFRKELIADDYCNIFERMFGLNPISIQDLERYIKYYIRANGEAKLPIKAINSGKEMLSVYQQKLHKKRKKMIRLIERMIGAKTRYEYAQEDYDCFSIEKNLYPFEEYPLSKNAFLGIVLGLAEKVHGTHMEIKDGLADNRYIIELYGQQEKPYIDRR